MRVGLNTLDQNSKYNIYIYANEPVGLAFGGTQIEIKQHLCNSILKIGAGEVLRMFDQVGEVVCLAKSKFRVAYADYVHNKVMAGERVVIYTFAVKQELRFKVETAGMEIGLNNLFNKLLSHANLDPVESRE